MTRSDADIRRSLLTSLVAAHLGLEWAKVHGQDTAPHQESVDRVEDALATFPSQGVDPVEVIDEAISKREGAWTEAYETWDALVQPTDLVELRHPREAALVRAGVDPLSARLTAGRHLTALTNATPHLKGRALELKTDG